MIKILEKRKESQLIIRMKISGHASRLLLMHHARLNISLASIVLWTDPICVNGKFMEHTNGIESEENIGRNADNNDPSDDEGINGLRTKEMFLRRTTRDIQIIQEYILPKLST
jgi:hypothetical protein